MKKAFFLAIFALFYAFLLDGALKPVKALESDLVESGVQTFATNEIWYNTGTSLPHPVDYSNSDLVNYAKRGDIYFEKEGINKTSLSIVEGVFYDETYDQLYVRLIEVTDDYGVCRGILTPTRFNKKHGQLYRMINVGVGQIEYPTLFCEAQLGKSARPMDSKDPSKDKTSWYSSELIWAAFYWHGLELDQDDNEPGSSEVLPTEVIADSHCRLVLHYSKKTTSESFSHYSHIVTCDNNSLYDEHIFRRQIEGNTYQCIVCGYTAEISDNKQDVFLNCHTEKEEFIEICPTGSYVWFTLNVECGKSFKMEATLLDKTKMAIQMRLYDSDMNLITDSPTLSNKNLTGTITEFLSVGKYYLKINYGSYLNGGDIKVTFEPTWGSYSLPLALNNSIEMTYHLHPTDATSSGNTAVFHNEDGGAGYYRITVNATRLDGTTVSYPEGSICVKDTNNINNIYKYNLTDENMLEAINTEGVNNLYAYFESNGYFYIHIDLPNAEYTSIVLSISRITDTYEITLADKMQQNFIETLIDENQKGDYVKAFTVDRLGYFIINFNATYSHVSTVKYVIFKEEYNPETYKYVITTEMIGELNISDNYQSRGVILTPGKYYIGYFGNQYEARIHVDINRDYYEGEPENYLLLDPGSGYAYGSEVRFNNGAYNNNTITEGFTRIIYINSNVENQGTSRLKYEFYSSNESIATVSIYGTILAKSVGSDQEVTIYAVSKASPWHVYKITIIVKDDTSNQTRDLYSKVNHTYSFAETDGYFQFHLTDADCPYPHYLDYMWSFRIIEGDVTASIDYFGRVTVSGPCTIELEGFYFTNMNIYVHITIHIV